MTRKYQRVNEDEPGERLAPDAPRWMRNEHAPNCGCAWCQPTADDQYYLLGSDHLQRGMSHDEACALLSTVEQSGDTRIQASMVMFRVAEAGPRFRLVLQLKGSTTWRCLPCRSLQEWHSIQRLWEGL